QYVRQGGSRRPLAAGAETADLEGMIQMSRKLLLSGAALAALILSATPSAALPDERIQAADEGGSAYGLYLAGRAALSEGAGQTATDYLMAAQAAAPGQASVRERAFTAALLAGDLDAAAQLAPSGEGVAPTV